MEGLKFENVNGLNICVSSKEEVEAAIKKLEDIHFGPGGEFEEYASLRGVGYEDDYFGEARELTEEEMEKAAKEVRKFAEEVKDMSINDAIEHLAKFVIEGKIE